MAAASSEQMCPIKVLKVLFLSHKAAQIIIKMSQLKKKVSPLPHDIPPFLFPVSSSICSPFC